ncbi:hypothetical protein KW795_01105 [Candidatus Microgenomates bacterium]|nr:hypothetical protein [Candidatus Microgenomates bacterium]
MNKYKILLIPLGAIIILVLVYFFAASYIIGRINTLNSTLTQTKADQVKLQSKLAILQDTQSNVDSFRDKLVFVLPGNNNALVALSQVKSLANSSNLVLSNISVHQSESKATSPKTTVSFDADGPLNSIFSFTSSLQTTDPITTIDKFKIANSGSIVRGSFAVSFYWAAFPTKFPSVVDPAKELTKEEMDLLTKLSEFTTPVFVDNEGNVPTKNTLRDNPFDFSSGPEEESGSEVASSTPIPTPIEAQ